MGSRYLVGLVGEGIAASMTPALHEEEGRALGLDYTYRILDLLQSGRRPTEIGDVVREASAAGFDALNITHPCKQLAMAAVDELHPDAADLGAVNLVVFEGGRTVGYNTDWSGYRDGFAAGLPGAELGHVVQIGCGGAGAATLYALLRLGAARATLVDADGARAHDLAQRMRGLFAAASIAVAGPAELDGALAVADGVVHATPVGMAHHPGVAFDPASLAPSAWVSEVVYRPLRTALVRACLARGHAVVDGGGMAVGQAYASVRIITGREPDRDRMRRHFRVLADIERRDVREGTTDG